MKTIPESDQLTLTRAARAALKLHDLEMDARRRRFNEHVEMLAMTLNQFPDEPTLALWRAFCAGCDFKHDN